MNPLYLLINHANRYIEEKWANNYLIFDSTDENKELLEKYNDFWNRIRDKIKEISGGVRSVFKEDGKRYSQVFLDDTLYKLNV